MSEQKPNFGREAECNSCPMQVQRGCVLALLNNAQIQILNQSTEAIIHVDLEENEWTYRDALVRCAFTGLRSAHEAIEVKEWVAWFK